MEQERPRPLVAGNWKMNGLRGSEAELCIIRDDFSFGGAVMADIVICPPFTLLTEFAALLHGTPIHVGAQDCHVDPWGAHTGDVSAEMVKDAGAHYVIVGHSERRVDHGETDDLVRRKAQAALRARLKPIICIGETAEERESGQTLAVVGRQLAGSVPDEIKPDALVIAYEPVWAIGTGLTPTVDDVAAVHAFIRAELIARFGEGARAVRILYGGSVKPGNARSLLEINDVDGALVGGASLKAADFLGIAKVYRPLPA